MSDTYARYCAKEVMSVEASKQIFKEDAYYNGQCKPGIKRLGSSQKRQGWNLEQDSLILHHGVTATHLWRSAAAAAAQSLQSCPTLCDPIDGSPPGSAVPGSLQARTLEWVAISFSNA